MPRTNRQSSQSNVKNRKTRKGRDTIQTNKIYRRIRRMYINKKHRNRLGNTANTSNHANDTFYNTGALIPARVPKTPSTSNNHTAKLMQGRLNKPIRKMMNTTNRIYTSKNQQNQTINKRVTDKHATNIKQVNTRPALLAARIRLQSNVNKIGYTNRSQINKVTKLYSQKRRTHTNKLQQDR